VGRNILIGGGGADSLTGGGADSILIGGSTVWDSNTAALQAIFAFWNRPDLSFQERISVLSGNGPKHTGLSGNYFLNANTVITDNAIDALYGGDASALDWFLVTNAKDTVAKHNSGDQVTKL
jgi:Ca2+-binding RTX toxin-like protein